MNDAVRDLVRRPVVCRVFVYLLMVVNFRILRSVPLILALAG